MSADAKSGTAPEDAISVDSRFGTLVFTKEQQLELPQGLFGFADRHTFGLANLPSDPDSQFKLFQSLEDKTLGFIVLPLLAETGLIDAADLEAACAELDIDKGDAAYMLIVTLRRLPNGVKLTCNLQAPIVIDTVTRKASQHVLQNSRYSVQHPL